MTSVRTEGLLGPLDRTELSTAEDQAARSAAEHLAVALLNQSCKQGQPTRAGVCTWCGQRCTSTAVYCDADCRADHEAQCDRQRRRGVVR